MRGWSARQQSAAILAARMYFGTTDLGALIESMPLDSQVALARFREWNNGLFTAFLMFAEPVGLGRITSLFLAPLTLDGGAAGGLTGLGGWVRSHPIGGDPLWQQFAISVDAGTDQDGLSRIHWAEQDDALAVSQVVCGVVALLPQASLFTVQPVTVDPPGRHSSDPAQRRATRNEQPEQVLVIDLRAPVKQDLDDVTHAERTYRHRWIVRGHWRDQTCGPRHAQRRRIFIAPHVKGNPDAPLLAPETVYRW